MELGNFTGSWEVSFFFTDKGSRVLEKMQHLFSDTNYAFRTIIDGSCCVIPPVHPQGKPTLSATSRDHCAVLGMLSGHAHGFAKTAPRGRNHGVGKPIPSCAAVCLWFAYPSLGKLCSPSTPAPAAAPWGEQSVVLAGACAQTQRCLESLSIPKQRSVVRDIFYEKSF